LVSDLLIGFYNPKMMTAVYLSFALVVGIGLYVRRKKSFSRILAGTFLGSVLFFLITNAAVWGFGTMYVLNLTGLLQSYSMAIPFFRNSLLGDLFYTGILVGAMEYVLYANKKLKILKTSFYSPPTLDD
jgi:hypothetical protein